jgi:hypothetical protein
MNRAATPALALRYQKGKTLQTGLAAAAGGTSACHKNDSVIAKPAPRQRPAQLDLRENFCHP